MDKDVKSTGTTTIGITCKEGVVLAADKRVTLGGRIVSNKTFEKIAVISDDIAITTAGLVSDVQLLTKIIRAQLKLNEIRRGKKSTVREAANLLAGLVYQNIRRMSMVQGITGFILGGKDSSGIYLYDLGVDGSVVESRDYIADGSGMMFAIGVLESHYKKNITISDGIKLAVKTINAAIQRDTASGDGIDIVTVTKDGAKKVLTREVEYKLTI